MEVPLIFMWSVILVIRGENILDGNDGIDEMAIDESTSNNILVHNTFHLSPMELNQKPEMDDTTQLQETPNMRTNDHFNFQTDHKRPMEAKIDSLLQSNRHLDSIISALDMKFNHILDKIHLDNERSSPKNSFDLIESLEVMNKLNNIQQYIMDSSNSGCRAANQILEPNQMQVIRKFIDEIGNPNTNNRFVTPNDFSQVLANSRKTIQYLDKVVETVREIDDRTIRMFDKSSRQFQELPSNFVSSQKNDDRTSRMFDQSSRQFQEIPSNFASNQNKVSGRFNNYYRGDKVGRCKNRRVRERSERFENTYGNTRKHLIDTNRVSYQPNKHNCHDLESRINGVYKFASMDEVSNEAGRFFYERFCDFDTDGGAWTLIQRRYAKKHQENFNRTWLDYKLGFGDLDKEFWFGNDFIHQLTFDEDVELRITLEDTSGRKDWAEYSLFKVDSERFNYNLMIGDYRGSIPDSFLYHNDQEFSTYDRQNDNNESVSCASSYGNGWWYNNCTESINRDYKGIMWENWLGSNSLISSKMMVRPKGIWNGEDGNEKEEYIFTSTSTDP